MFFNFNGKQFGNMLKKYLAYSGNFCLDLIDEKNQKNFICKIRKIIIHEVFFLY